MKNFSQSCINNRDLILQKLKPFFIDRHKVLEIGSGTGQHAVYFAEAMPHLQWQCGDLEDNHAGIQAWVDDAKLDNVCSPIVIDAEQHPWEFGQFDAVFTANTLHIMSWLQVEKTFEQMQDVLLADAKLAIYGPFNYGGTFTSESNARFDNWLKQNGSHQGIRDFEAVSQLAAGIGLTLVSDEEMPANNRLLLWRYRP